MRAAYGSEGYGWYFMIVEMLREESDYRLHMRGKYVWDAFAMQLQCTADAAHNFIQDCIEEFKLFDSDGEYFWSNSLIRRMEKKDEKSEKARQAALSRWDKQKDADAMQTQCDRNAIKEKKVKEKKGNESKEELPATTDLSPAIKIFCKNIHPITPIEAEKLHAYIEDGFDATVITYAIEKAVLAGVRKMSYIDGILKQLRTAGIMTMESVEAAERDYQAKKDKPKETTRGAVEYTDDAKPPDPEQMKRNQEFMKGLLGSIGKSMEGETV